MNQLEQLKNFSVIVADTGDIDSIRQFSPEDATTNPSLILKTAQIPKYKPLIDAAIEMAEEQGGPKETKLINAADQLAVNIGVEILKHIPGRISTEVDAKLSFECGLSIAKARKLVRLYQQAGIDKSRILIKLAATWEGIAAAAALEKEGINCNLTLIFSFAQAQACADAGVFLISPFVGRIYDWYHAKNPTAAYDPEQDPGVLSVRNIYNFYKKCRYSTVIMGASFRRKEQILALAGCDRLTISPHLLKELQESTDPVERKLISSKESYTLPEPIKQSQFLWELNSDAMASEKLADGIRLFATDQQKLEDMLYALL